MISDCILFISYSFSKYKVLFRREFAKWIFNNLQKEETMRTLFSDENMFEVEGVYNSQKKRIWAASRFETDKRGAIKMKQKFRQKDHDLAWRLH
jgi:hypothetical protein